jgi:hypothetical protein
MINIRDTALQLRNLVRDAIIVIIAIVSRHPEEHREANGFSWEPIREVVNLFALAFLFASPITPQGVQAFRFPQMRSAGVRK